MSCNICGSKYTNNDVCLQCKDVESLQAKRDAALARAEAAEQDLSRESQEAMGARALWMSGARRASAAESRLAAATALLVRIKSWADSPLGEAGEPWVCLHNAVDGFLSATPAPAATAEPECNYAGRCNSSRCPKHRGGA